MTAPLAALDAFGFPVTLGAVTRTLVLTETGGGTPAAGAIQSIAAGDYYAMADAPPSGYSSMFAAIETALDAASGNGSAYTVAWATPSVSTGQTKGGITITCDGAGGTTDWQLDFNSGSFTMDPRIFGFPAAQTAIEASSSNAITSEMTAYGMWVPPQRASQKGPKREIYVQGRSGGRIASRRTNRLSKRDVRHFNYKYIPAGHLFFRRNQIP